MRQFLPLVVISATLAAACPASAIAQTGKPTVQKVDVPATGLNLRDCMDILTGLGQIDFGRIADGKQAGPFKLRDNVKDAISHNLFTLSSVQQEIQASIRRTQTDVRGESTGDLNERQKLILDQRISDYLERPCRAELDHIKKSDLDLDKNDIQPSAIRNIWKILDR